MCVFSVVSSRPLLFSPSYLGEAADAAFEAFEAFETLDLSVVSAFPMLITALPVCLRTWLTRAGWPVVDIELSPVSCIT